MRAAHRPPGLTPSAARSARPARSRLRRGFTLVEVLVAVAIMAVVTTLTWRGIDGMTRTREISQASLDRSLRLGTVLAQWERDLQAVQDGMGVPGLAFDGSHLRLTRASEGGLLLVVWSLRDGALYRWASTPLTEISEVQDAWLRSQQLLGDEPGTLKVQDEVSAWQVYFYRGNGWSNPQSAGDRPSGLGAPSSAEAAGAAPGPGRGADTLPTGVRLLMTLPAGSLTRDVLMNGAGY